MRSASLLISFLLLTINFYGQNINAIISSDLPDAKKAENIYHANKKIMHSGSFEEALHWIEKGLEYGLKSNDTIVSYFYVDKGDIYYMQSKHTKALENMQLALPGAKKYNNHFNLHSIYVIMALCNKNLNKADSALYYFRKSEDVAVKYFPYRLWVNYTELGAFFAGIDNNAEAEKYYTKAYEITKEKGVRMDYGLTMYNLVNFYYKQNAFDKYGKLINEQQEFNKKNKKDYSKDPSHSFLFPDWEKNTPLTTKVNFFKQVREELLRENFLISASIVNEQIASLYEKEKQYDNALDYVKEGVKLAEQENSTANLLIYNKIAYRLHKKMGNVQQANATADIIFALKDSVAAKQNIELAMDLDAKYQTEKKEKEIALLDAENKVKQNEIVLLTTQKQIDRINLMRQTELQEALKNENELKDSLFTKELYANQLLVNENNLKTSELNKEQQLKAALARENSLQTNQLNKEKQIKWGLASGIALLSFSGIVIFALYKNQKKKNTLIQKQATDLEVLMKEIHHRVKNNLQVVSSLLDLQSHSITDSQAHEAVKEGKNRVQSMALIHQNLYSEGNIKGIKLKEYVTNLLQTLCDSYNISNDKVKINATIDDLNLDVDTMIPLGLVLNELVSNAFKYAFNQNQNGELNIFLKEQANQLHLMVSDNGTGFPIGMDVKKGKSFGLKMIRAFAQKLKATLDIYNNNGAVVEMKISKFKIA